MKPVIHIDDHQIHIDDEHYTLFICFKQQPIIKKDDAASVEEQTRPTPEKFNGTKKCIICGKEFQSKSNLAKICSKNCKMERDRRYAREYQKKNKKGVVKSDLDETLQQIENNKRQPYKVTPPVL
jgi:predicted nucleic acid-binding Zn ribbon protein